MPTIATITLLLCLLSILIQDVRERQVFVVLLIAVILNLGFLHYSNSNFMSFVISSFLNFTILCCIGVLLFLVAKYILKKDLKESMGFGDVLFFSAMAIGFPTATFVVLFSFSLVFSLLVFRLFLSKSKNNTVPLAGLQALFLFLVFVVNSSFNFTNLYLI